MIDKALLRSNPAFIEKALHKKDPTFPVKDFLNLDKEYRLLKQEIEELKSEKNNLAQEAKNGITDQIRQKSITISKTIKEKTDTFESVEKQLKTIALSCPDIPLEDVPEGDKSENKVVKTYGEKPEYDFEPENHVTLNEQHQWFDFQAAVKTTGSNFVVYKNQGAQLVYALAMFMLKHNSTYGYNVTLPPALVNEKTLEVSGNFPKFKDQVYAINEDKYFTIPTSEVGLANLYRNEIIPEQDLPIKMTSWTSCFRREAGGYGSNERGLIRIHQFEKVELFALTKPENSNKELEKMIECAESLLQKLGLHYRVSLLAGQDCSFQSAKTFDIEVWLPGQKEYYEVSSASNCTDFQARRGKIRYRKNQESKPELVHTLNASSLALPRLMVALIETYQQKDGSIEFPEILKKELW